MFGEIGKQGGSVIEHNLLQGEIPHEETSIFLAGHWMISSEILTSVPKN
jgi:hypothetical protein